MTLVWPYYDLGMALLWPLCDLWMTFVWPGDIRLLDSRTYFHTQHINYLRPHPSVRHNICNVWKCSHTWNTIIENSHIHIHNILFLLSSALNANWIPFKLLPHTLYNYSLNLLELLDPLYLSRTLTYLRVVRWQEEKKSRSFETKGDNREMHDIGTHYTVLLPFAFSINIHAPVIWLIWLWASSVSKLHTRWFCTQTDWNHNIAWSKSTY